MAGAHRCARLLLTTMLLVAALATPVSVGAPSANAADIGVTVSGNRFLLDGVPFLPHGFNMVGLLTPDWCDRSATQGARDHFGQAEMDAARAWRADTLRFQVSQRGLADPTVPQADRDAYLAKVVAGVRLARTNGFVVIVSMQDQANGCGDVHPMPSSQTVDAWNALAPALMADPYVLFELFNEPRNQADGPGWAQWKDGGSTPDGNLGDPAVGHQALVDHLRALGSTNVLIADSARLGELTVGMPRLSDPAENVAYAIHPYVYPTSRWAEQYGAPAGDVPMIATEWNYLAKGCGTSDERTAPDLLTYLRRHSIGVLGHAFDSLGTTVADWAWTPTQCGTKSGGSGRALQDFFGGLATTDLVPPAPPGDVTATDVGSAQVTLTWTPPGDSDVAGYEVARNGAIVASPSIAQWSDTAVQPGTSYTYVVRSVDTAGNVSRNPAPLVVTTTAAPPPAPDTTSPTAPTRVRARVVSPTRVTVSWQPSTDDVGVIGYRVARNGVPLGTVPGYSFTDAVTAGTYTYTVTALDAAGNASTPSSASAIVPVAAPQGLTGTYFDTATFTSQKLKRIDPTVNFAWGAGRPASGVGADTFSVEWTGRLLPVADGTYTFYLASDDGMRLLIDGSTVVDDFTAHALRETKRAVTLSADRAHVIEIDYYDRTGAATAKVSWSGPGFGKQILPSSQLLSR